MKSQMASFTFTRQLDLERKSVCFMTVSEQDSLSISKVMRNFVHCETLVPKSLFCPVKLFSLFRFHLHLHANFPIAAFLLLWNILRMLCFETLGTVRIMHCYVTNLEAHSMVICQETSDEEN